MTGMDSKGGLAAVLLSAAVATSTGCSTVTAPPAATRESVATILDSYVAAMKSGDYGNVPFAGDVTFRGPLTDGPIVGESNVRAFLRRVSTDVKDIRVKRQVIDGETACLIAELETKNGTVVSYIEFFRLVDGRIAEIYPYFDPRPLIR